MNRLLKIITCAVFTLLSLSIVYIVYLIVFPINVLTVNSAKVLTPTVKAGEALVYELDYCKSGNYESSVTRSLTDSIVYNFPQVNGNLEGGCHVQPIVAVVIPSEEVVPTGTYYLKITVEYDINPLHKETVTFQTDTFEIVGE